MSLRYCWLCMLCTTATLLTLASMSMSFGGEQKTSSGEGFKVYAPNSNLLPSQSCTRTREQQHGFLARGPSSFRVVCDPKLIKTPHAEAPVTCQFRHHTLECRRHDMLSRSRGCRLTRILNPITWKQGCVSKGEGINRLDPLLTGLTV